MKSFAHNYELINRPISGGRPDENGDRYPMEYSLSDLLKYLVSSIHADWAAVTQDGLNW
jgi:hypothetical protein